jgi:glutaminase
MPNRRQVVHGIGAALPAAFVIGDAEHHFTVVSVSKPCVFALVCDDLGS